MIKIENVSAGLWSWQPLVPYLRRPDLRVKAAILTAAVGATEQDKSCFNGSVHGSQTHCVPELRISAAILIAAVGAVLITRMKLPELFTL